MNIKKILAGTFLSGMCAVFLLFPVHTQAAEESQATTIVTEVPASHTVKVVIEGQGTVEADGKTYSSTQDIEVGRLKEQEYKIAAANGWKLEHVTYGAPGSETEVKLTDSVFTAFALYEDGNVLTVTFVKETSGTGTSPGTDTQPGESGTSGGQTSAGQSVKTGDESSGTGTSPGTDTKPGGSGTSGGQTSAGQGVKTGDESQPLLWAAVAGLSLLLLGVMNKAKRKNSREY